MFKYMFLFAVLLMSSCATFDSTHIRPGDRVPGLGFSFVAPTQAAWFASEYGTSNRIKLNQFNDQDSYSIVVSLNRGPRRGMYKSAEMHLRVLKQHRAMEFKASGFFWLDHHEWLEPTYGKLCVGYSSKAEDWKGRGPEGPKIIDSIGLVCEHPEIDNVLIDIELSRRSELSAPDIDLIPLADALFSSFEYKSL